MPMNPGVRSVRKIFRSPLGALSVFIICGTLPGVAAAEEEHEVSQTFDIINEIDPTIIDASVPASAVNNGWATKAAGSTFQIQSTGGDDIEFRPHGSPEIGIGLPFSDEIAASDATDVSPDGLVAIENPNGSSIVPIPREDGSLQIVTVIDSSSAPVEYSFHMELPEGATVRQDGESISFFDAQGTFLAGLAPAWAKDAHGTDIPTRYEVSGTTVTQIVEHSNSYAYPIVADPWLGKNLFKNLYRDRYKGDYRYNGTVTAWGAATLAGGGGRFILDSAGWDEWTSKWPAITKQGHTATAVSVSRLGRRRGIDFHRSI